MKKALMLVLAALMLVASLAGTSIAQEDDETCPCGYDDDGVCLPCDQ